MKPFDRRRPRLSPQRRRSGARHPAPRRSCTGACGIRRARGVARRGCRDRWRRNRRATHACGRRAEPPPRARDAVARRQAATPGLRPRPPAPGSSPAPCRPRSTGWRPGRDAAASGARRRRAASAGLGSRSAAARGRRAPSERSGRPASALRRCAGPSPRIRAAGRRGSPGADHDSFISSSVGTKPT